VKRSHNLPLVLIRICTENKICCQSESRLEIKFGVSPARTDNNDYPGSRSTSTPGLPQQLVIEQSYFRATPLMYPSRLAISSYAAAIKIITETIKRHTLTTDTCGTADNKWWHTAVFSERQFFQCNSKITDHDQLSVNSQTFHKSQDFLYS